MIDAFERVIAETTQLRRLAWLCRWNVIGADAALASDEYRYQTEELSSALDELAAHLKGLGGILSPERLNSEGQSDTLGLHNQGSNSLFEVLASRHERMDATLQTAGDLAEAEADYGSLHLIAARQRAHRTLLWRCQRAICD
ncbi:MAG: hypothetical protein AAFN79_12055 [Pseudomonadota bacterium]